jgi:hypothetical protein
MTGNPHQERADFYRLRATPEERLATAAHELGHYEMAKRAGVHPEGITIGHHPTNSRSASVLFGSEGIDTGLTHSVDQWRQAGRLITDPDESQMFSLNYLKSLYAGEAAEEIITGRANNSGAVDGKDARRWMMEHGLPNYEIDRLEAKLKRRAREELRDPETKRKLTYAAQQLAEHHFDGQKHPASTIDHYLSGGTRQNLPKEGQ